MTPSQITSSQVITLVVVVGALVIALTAWLVARKRRSRALEGRFGPEYARAVETAGKKSKAEAELEARARRVDQLTIRPLTEAERGRYAQMWHVAQERFVDSPAIAVGEADQLVTEVMRVRGYPMADFEQRAADVSVDHPHLVTNYRAAHAIALNTASQRASTEDLRQAMVHYRALFEELLGAPVKEPELVGH
jgi:hypothetical protein